MVGAAPPGTERLLRGAEVPSSKLRAGHSPFPSHSSLSPAFPFPSPLGGKPARSGDAVPRQQNDQHPPTAGYVAVVGVSPPGSAPPPAVPCAVTPPRTTTLIVLPSLSQQRNAHEKGKRQQTGSNTASKDRQYVSNPHWDPRARVSSQAALTSRACVRLPLPCSELLQPPASFTIWLKAQARLVSVRPQTSCFCLWLSKAASTGLVPTDKRMTAPQAHGEPRCSACREECLTGNKLS